MINAQVQKYIFLKNIFKINIKYYKYNFHFKYSTFCTLFIDMIQFVLLLFRTLYFRHIEINLFDNLTFI